MIAPINYLFQIGEKFQSTKTSKYSINKQDCIICNLKYYYMKNIKIAILTIASVIISTIIFTSCSKERAENITFDENTISKRLKFVDVTTRINSVQNRNDSASKLVIVSWDEWGRASRKCAGWGLCNAEWFYFETRIVRNNSSILEFNSIVNKYYIDILLAEQVPSDIPNSSLTFGIDQNFEINTKEAIGKNLIFKQGQYPFINDLGNFGGYRIYLD